MQCAFAQPAAERPTVGTTKLHHLFESTHTRRQKIPNQPQLKYNYFCFKVENLLLLRHSITILMNKYKAKEVIKMLEADGWILDRMRGSPRQFKHPTKPGIVTVNGKPSQVLEQFILNSIWKQAGWK